MSAILSACGLYRYTLTRDAALLGSGRMLFISLNPSVADAERNDPTVRKDIGFASRAGARYVDLGNLYGYNKTLIGAETPVRPEHRAAPHTGAMRLAGRETDSGKQAAEATRVRLADVNLCEPQREKARRGDSGERPALLHKHSPLALIRRTAPECRDAFAQLRGELARNGETK